VKESRDPAMARAYRIADWYRYEVLYHGSGSAAADTPAEKLRRGALEYVKAFAFGRRPSASFRRAVRLSNRAVGAAGGDCALMGVWLKCLEVAGQNSAGRRGWIVDDKDRPVDGKGFAEMVGYEYGHHIDDLLQVLCSPEVGWLEYVDFPGFSEITCKCGDAFLNQNQNKPKDNIPKPKETEQPDGRLAEHMDGCLDLEKIEKPHGVLDLEKMDRMRAEAKNEVKAILGINTYNPSEKTTFGDIFGQVEAKVRAGTLGLEIYGQMVREAKGCRTARSPKRAFVARMKKQPYGYIRPGLLGRVFR